jgi:hypothetical protein
MTQTIKLRKNKLNTRRRMKGGDGMKEGMNAFIAGLQLVATNPLCGPALVAAKTTLLSTFMGFIPDEPNTNNFIKGLGIKATLKELIETSLRTITCDDIGVIATVLPKLLVFDKIQEILKADNEAAKKATEYYNTLKSIITDSKNQDLACRVLTAYKDKNYITDDHIKAFSIFIVGKENVCQGGIVSNISESAENLWSTLSGKKTDDSAENTNDKRCGEDLIVKKTFFSGEYCSPKPAPNVVEAAKPEQAPQSPDAPVITTETPSKPVVKASMPEQAPPPEKEYQTISAEPVKGGNRRKYNRANKSKKNKKSKSKKSKRSKK